MVAFILKLIKRKRKVLTERNALVLKLTIIFFIKKISIIVHILIANVRLFMKQERIDQKKISYFVYIIVYYVRKMTQMICFIGCRCAFRYKY